MKKACVLLANGCEEVEAITPIDYLRRAGIEVTAIGVTGMQVEGSRKIVINADTGKEALSKTYDCVVVPGGGKGADNLAHDTEVRDFIIRHAGQGKLVAAICAAPAVVLHGSCHLLDGKNFTGFPGSESQVKTGKHSKAHVVIDGNILTSQAAGTAGEFAFAIVKELVGADKARELAMSLVLSV